MDFNLIETFNDNCGISFVPGDITTKECKQYSDKIDEILKLIDMPHHEYEVNKKINFKKNDFHMRVDIALPDNVNYKNPSILEIEPLASGSGVNSVILKSCVDLPFFQSVDKYITSNIFKSNINYFTSDLFKLSN